MTKYLSVLVDFDEPLRAGDIIIFQREDCVGYGPRVAPHEVIARKGGWEGISTDSLFSPSTTAIVAVLRFYPNPYPKELYLNRR